MATTLKENLKTEGNVKMASSVEDFKRKMREQAGKLSKLAKTSGGRGARVEGIVMKRLAAKPATGSGKAPPTKIVMMVVSPTVEIEVIGPKDGGDSDGDGDNFGPTAGKVEQGSTYWYGAFDLAANVTEGCRVVLVNPRGEIYDNRLSLSGGAELMEKPSLKMLTSLGPVCYRLPTLENMATHTNVLLPVNVTHLQDTVRAFTVGFDNPEVYVKCDRNDPDRQVLSAYVRDSKGYPFTVSWGTGESCHSALVNMRLYDNHLVEFGICNLEVWSELAPVLMECFVGCVVGYINQDVSRGMDINHGSSVEGCPYEYGLTVTASAFHVDMAATVRNVGLEVSAQYVLNHFDGEQFLESDFGSTNVLNKHREKGNVVNLSEYTGKLTTYTENTNTWSFYAVVNPTNVEEIQGSEMTALRKGSSAERREEALGGGGEEGAGLKLEFQPQAQYIFAVRQDVVN